MNKYFVFITLIIAVIVSACSSGSSTKSSANNSSNKNVNFESAVFTNSTSFSQPAMNLTPGYTSILRTVVEDGIEIEVIKVLDETKIIDNIICQAVSEKEFEDELLVEDGVKWYAQDDAGNLWLMGEKSTAYEYDEEEVLLGSEVEEDWEAGKDIALVGSVAKGGIVMLSNMKVGDKFSHEIYTGNIEFEGEVVSLNETIETTVGVSYANVIKIKETSTEDGVVVVEYKYYALGIGLIKEEEVDSEENDTDLLATFEQGANRVPDFNKATFSNPTNINNEYHPLIPGTNRTGFLEGEDEDEELIFEVLEETKIVNGVECVIFRDRVYVDDLLMEDTKDWFAQDDAGNLWYMGEEVINYEYDDEGNLIETNDDGSWEAGVDGAKPGYQMPVNLMPGYSWYQEYLVGEAEDMGYVVATGVTVTLKDGTVFTNCIQTVDWAPLETIALEFKYFAPGVGLIMETSVDPTDPERLEVFEEE